MRRAAFLIVVIILLQVRVHAQYIGGSGKGSNTTAAILNLNATTIYAGGMDDGQSAVNASSLSLTAGNTMFSGGNDDGASMAPVNSVSLTASGIYAGGADDGAGSTIASAISLLAAGNYNGGADDGFNNTSVSAQSLNAASIYSGGSDDGISAANASSQSLTASTIYVGGSDDGIGSVVNTAQSLAATASPYAGGADDGLSTVTVGALSIVALPVSWETFTAILAGADARLDWKLSYESNNRGFYVERGYDGYNFTSIGFVPAKKSGSAYSYTDFSPADYCNEPACDAVFYRLKHIGLDQHFDYSQTRRLQLQKRSSFAYVYPNPASDKIIVRVLGADPNARCSVSLFNSLGQLVLSQELPAGRQGEIDVMELPSGIYYLRLSIGEQTSAYQVSITH